MANSSSTSRAGSFRPSPRRIRRNWAIKGVVNGHNRENIEPSFWKFVRAEANARFLFGEEVIAASAALRADVAAVLAYCDIKPDHPDFQQLNNAKYQVCNGSLRLFKTQHHYSPHTSD
jgi:hypothetical protein